MKFVPTYNELALACLVAYTVADKAEGEDLNSMIKKASQNKNGCLNPSMKLEQGITMQVSMNTYNTVFIKFSRLINVSSFQHLAEIIYDENNNISVRGEESASDAVKVMLQSELDK